MNIRKRVFIACEVGLVISCIGMGLMSLGDWGPCGPGSLSAGIGFWMNLMPVFWLSKLIPGIEALTEQWHAGLVLIILWPAFLWSLVAFIALSVWSRFRRYAHKTA